MLIRTCLFSPKTSKTKTHQVSTLYFHHKGDLHLLDLTFTLIWQSCRPGLALVLPGEKELIRAMYDQIGKEEQVISPPYTRTPLDASMRGTEEDEAG